MSFTVRKIRTAPLRRSFPWRRYVIALLTIGRPLLGWYGAWKRRQEEQKRTRALQKILLILVALLCALLLLGGTARALFGLRSMGMHSLINVTGGEAPRDPLGRINVLLLGEGNAAHDGTDLTDTIIVASLDPIDTQAVAALSLPRDLYFLSTEKMGKGKLNSMYRDFKGYLRAQGKPSGEASHEAMRTLGEEIGRILGLPIQGVVKVDFDGLVKAVDILEGIDIVVPEDIVDTEYPDENYGYETFSITAGPHHIDGATALKYARSRHSSSDFSRSARQQQIIMAMVKRAKEQQLHRDVGAITELLGVLTKNVETTFSVREIIALAGLADQGDLGKVVTMQLSDRNGLYDSLPMPGGLLYAPPRNLFDGASVLLPVSIPEFPVTWKQVRLLSHFLFDRREVYLAHPTVSILNAGAKPGSARKLANELVRFGFDVTHVANAENLSPQDHSWIVRSPEIPQNVQDFFTGSLGLSTILNLDLSAEETASITIVLGKDYAYQPLQDLVQVD